MLMDHEHHFRLYKFLSHSPAPLIFHPHLRLSLFTLTCTFRENVVPCRCRERGLLERHRRRRRPGHRAARPDRVDAAEAPDRVDAAEAPVPAAPAAEATIFCCTFLQPLAA